MNLALRSVTVVALTLVTGLGLGLSPGGSARPAASDVTALIPTDGLIGHWPLDGSPDDTSGNGNDGIVDGATLPPASSTGAGTC